MGAIQLNPGREKSLLRRHPWIFSGAVMRVHGNPEAGETVEILSAEGKFLGWGAYSPASQIRARVWSWERDIRVDEDFFHSRLNQAIAGRARLIEAGATDAIRLVHGESDGLPGLIVDRYADVVVMQALSSGPEYWREALASLLQEVTGASCIYERSDADVRALEGLAPRCGVLRGAEPPARLPIFENGLKFWVDVHSGHKTGFYLDQRANRNRLRGLAEGKDILDCFSYSGAFSAFGLYGGAMSTLRVDSSAEALAAGRENLALNHLPAERDAWMQGDVFQVLRSFRDQGREFDLIILDPPKFAPTAAQAERAARGYKDINLLAFKLLRAGGLLVTFSCSGGISAELFQKIVAGAALDAGVEAQIQERLHQDMDHPVSLYFPEGAYLKGLVIRVC